MKQLEQNLFSFVGNLSPPRLGLPFPALVLLFLLLGDDGLLADVLFGLVIEFLCFDLGEARAAAVATADVSIGDIPGELEALLEINEAILSTESVLSPLWSLFTLIGASEGAA